MKERIEREDRRKNEEAPVVESGKNGKTRDSGIGRERCPMEQVMRVGGARGTK